MDCISEKSQIKYYNLRLEQAKPTAASVIDEINPEPMPGRLESWRYRAGVSESIQFQ